MMFVSSSDRAVRVSQWDGVALLGICTGIFVYNWLTQFTELPLDQCLWAAFLAAFPEVFIARIQVVELESTEPAWLPTESDTEPVSEDGPAAAEAA